ncbi:MAG: Fe2+-dependent dioxygenase [Sphingomonas bacterium]|jgi:PKHD-type hydroxylase|nr:Fe2+-dependent dioxygenase [Sphingomonas bacterium]MDB5683837.1 Fe2+-dependent dioxygenase [Sphingomonas bacterium]MDB5718876.1 Fe2+-dependent dioxygenase [Sphingomonas bacterium]
MTMPLVIPGVLTRDQVTTIRRTIEAAEWIDGNATSGAQSALAKRNRQLPEESPAAREMGGVILDALGKAGLFIAAALPLKVFPPMFNRYAGGEAFGMHVDNAIRLRRGSDFRLRSDLSATVFLCDPDEYDGGELISEGGAPIKLPAGDMILYPASTLHRVSPVTRGERIASFFWIQSMVRDGSARKMLLDLDLAIQSLVASQGNDDPAIVALTGVYHNLLRRWADC